jgi:hypothetical protein
MDGNEGILHRDSNLLYAGRAGRIDVLFLETQIPEYDLNVTWSLMLPNRLEVQTVLPDVSYPTSIN